MFPPDWLGDPIWAKVTLIIAHTREFILFLMKVLYAGLQPFEIHSTIFGPSERKSSSERHFANLGQKLHVRRSHYGMPLIVDAIVYTYRIDLYEQSGLTLATTRAGRDRGGVVGGPELFGRDAGNAW